MIEGEADFAQAFLLHGLAQSLAVLGEEQQEASAAGADGVAATARNGAPARSARTSSM